MKCEAHPDAETNLKCGKCGKLICPKCLVETPVGSRCRQCARPTRLPTYTVSLPYYLRAAGAGLVIGIIAGIIWILVDALSLFYIDLLLGPAIGYSIGEVVSLSVNRKRSTGLAIIGGAAVIESFLLKTFLLGGGFFFGLFSLFSLAAVALGIFFAVKRLR
ncbi:MAG: hypothetical protein Q7R57_09535 [Dehalococcoidales bacterium]|nr:hypothetical protein [Dehalococcoidales bacterium]